MNILGRLKLDVTMMKSILAFAIPVFFDQGFVAILLTFNTILLKGAGTEAISAVGMVDSVHMLVSQFLIALSAGGTVVVAQNMGRGDTREAAKAAKQALFTGVFLAVIISVIIFAVRKQLLLGLFGSVDPGVMQEANNYYLWSIFAYPFLFFTFQAFGIMRGSGDSKTPMIINMATTVVNVLLGFVLIRGINAPGGMIGGLGATGAGITFVLSRVVGCGIIGFAMKSKRFAVSIKFFEKFKIDWGIVKEIYRIAIPASTESVLFMLGRLICQIFVTTMGTGAIAVNTVANSVSVLHMIPANSMGIVATALVGRAVGMGEESRVKKVLVYCVIIAVACNIVILLPFYFGASWFAGLYSDVPAIISEAAFVLRTYVFACLIWPVAFVMPNGFRGAGDALYPLVTAIITMWSLRVMLGYYLGVTLGLGVLGIFIGMYADWAIRNILYIVRYKRETWLKRMRKQELARRAARLSGPPGGE